MPARHAADRTSGTSNRGCISLVWGGAATLAVGPSGKPGGLVLYGYGSPSAEGGTGHREEEASAGPSSTSDAESQVGLGQRPNSACG